MYSFYRETEPKLHFMSVLAPKPQLKPDFGRYLRRSSCCDHQCVCVSVCMSVCPSVRKITDQHGDGDVNQTSCLSVRPSVCHTPVLTKS